MEQRNRKYEDDRKKKNENEDLTDDYTEMDLEGQISMTCTYAPPEYFGFFEEAEEQTDAPAQDDKMYPFSHE